MGAERKRTKPRGRAGEEARRNNKEAWQKSKIEWKTEETIPSMCAKWQKGSGGETLEAGPGKQKKGRVWGGLT